MISLLRRSYVSKPRLARLGEPTLGGLIKLSISLVGVQARIRACTPTSEVFFDGRDPRVRSQSLATLGFDV